MMAAPGRSPHLPPGFKFRPSDEELASHYLLPRSTYGVVAEADILEHEPWELPDVWKKSTSSPEDDEWYFFTPRRICTSASASGAPARQHRLTRGGYWKATGKDRAINIEQYFLFGSDAGAAAGAPAASLANPGACSSSSSSSSSGQGSPGCTPGSPAKLGPGSLLGWEATQGGHTPGALTGPGQAASGQPTLGQGLLLPALLPGNFACSSPAGGLPSLVQTSEGQLGQQGQQLQVKRMRLVVMKKTLVFYQGRAPSGTKTNWIMHEYRLEEEKPAAPAAANPKGKGKGKGAKGNGGAGEGEGTAGEDGHQTDTAKEGEDDDSGVEEETEQEGGLLQKMRAPGGFLSPALMERTGSGSGEGSGSEGEEQLAGTPGARNAPGAGPGVGDTLALGLAGALPAGAFAGLAWPLNWALGSPAAPIPAPGTPAGSPGMDGTPQPPSSPSTPNGAAATGSGASAQLPGGVGSGAGVAVAGGAAAAAGAVSASSGGAVADLKLLPSFRVVLCKVFNKRRDCKVKGTALDTDIPRSAVAFGAPREDRALGLAAVEERVRGVAPASGRTPRRIGSSVPSSQAGAKKTVCGKRPSKQGSRGKGAKGARARGGGYDGDGVEQDEEAEEEDDEEAEEEDDEDDDEEEEGEDGEEEGVPVNGTRKLLRGRASSSRVAVRRPPRKAPVVAAAVRGGVTAALASAATASAAVARGTGNCSPPSRAGVARGAPLAATGSNEGPSCSSGGNLINPSTSAPQPFLGAPQASQQCTQLTYPGPHMGYSNSSSQGQPQAHLPLGHSGTGSASAFSSGGYNNSNNYYNSAVSHNVHHMHTGHSGVPSGWPGCAKVEDQSMPSNGSSPSAGGSVRTKGHAGTPTSWGGPEASTPHATQALSGAGMPLPRGGAPMVSPGAAQRMPWKSSSPGGGIPRGARGLGSTQGSALHLMSASSATGTSGAPVVRPMGHMGGTGGSRVGGMAQGQGPSAPNPLPPPAPSTPPTLPPPPPPSAAPSFPDVSLLGLPPLGKPPSRAGAGGKGPSVHAHHANARANSMQPQASFQGTGGVPAVHQGGPQGFSPCASNLDASWMACEVAGQGMVYQGPAQSQCQGEGMPEVAEVAALEPLDYLLADSLLPPGPPESWFTDGAPVLDGSRMGSNSTGEFPGSDEMPGLEGYNGHACGAPELSQGEDGPGDMGMGGGREEEQVPHSEEGMHCECLGGPELETHEVRVPTEYCEEHHMEAQHPAYYGQQHGQQQQQHFQHQQQYQHELQEHQNQQQFQQQQQQQQLQHQQYHQRQHHHQQQQQQQQQMEAAGFTAAGAEGSAAWDVLTDNEDPLLPLPLPLPLPQTLQVPHSLRSSGSSGSDTSGVMPLSPLAGSDGGRTAARWEGPNSESSPGADSPSGPTAHPGHPHGLMEGDDFDYSGLLAGPAMPQAHHAPGALEAEQEAHAHNQHQQYQQQQQQQQQLQQQQQQAQGEGPMSGLGSQPLTDDFPWSFPTALYEGQDQDPFEILTTQAGAQGVGYAGSVSSIMLAGAHMEGMGMGAHQAAGLLSGQGQLYAASLPRRAPSQQPAMTRSPPHPGSFVLRRGTRGPAHPQGLAKKSLKPTPSPTGVPGDALEKKGVQGSNADSVPSFADDLERVFESFKACKLEEKAASDKQHCFDKQYASEKQYSPGSQYCPEKAYQAQKKALQRENAVPGMARRKQVGAGNVCACSVCEQQAQSLRAQGGDPTMLHPPPQPQSHMRHQNARGPSHSHSFSSDTATATAARASEAARRALPRQRLGQNQGMSLGQWDGEETPEMSLPFFSPPASPQRSHGHGAPRTRGPLLRAGWVRSRTSGAWYPSWWCFPGGASPAAYPRLVSASSLSLSASASGSESVPLARHGQRLRSSAPQQQYRAPRPSRVGNALSTCFPCFGRRPGTLP